MLLDAANAHQPMLVRVAREPKLGHITKTAIAYKVGNGNVVVISTDGEVSVECSNNNTILKESKWFKENRTWPANGK